MFSTSKKFLGTVNQPKRGLVVLGLLVLMGISSPLLSQEEQERFDLVGRLIDKEDG